MAWVVAAVSRARHSPEILPLSLTSRVDAADPNRAVPTANIPFEEMPPESEMRNRLPQALSTRAVAENGDSSVDPSATSTPASSNDIINEKDSMIAKRWHCLLDRMASSFSFGSSDEGIEEYNTLHGYDKIIKEKVEDLPVGFPQLAALLTSDPDWTIFRGFKEMHARILCHLMVEITDLEKELRKLDEEDVHTAKYRLRMVIPIKEGMDTTQRDLMDRIKAKIKEYDEFLLNHTSIQALGPPPQRNYRSVFNWVFTRKPLCPGYYDFIYHNGDYVSASGCLERGGGQYKGNWFEECIRWCVLRWPDSGLRKSLQSKTEIEKTTDPIVRHYSTFRLAVFSKILLVSLAVAILLVPVFLLFLVSMTRLEMALTVLAFVLLFCVMMATTTDAKTQEVLMGTAAYAAVLVTFLGNLNGNLSYGPGNNIS